MKKLLSTLLVFSTVFSTVACTAAFAKENVTTSTVQTAEVDNKDNIANTENSEATVSVESAEEDNSPSIISRIAKGLGWGTVCVGSFLFSSFVRANTNLVLAPLMYEATAFLSAFAASYHLFG